MCLHPLGSVSLALLQGPDFLDTYHENAEANAEAHCLALSPVPYFKTRTMHALMHMHILTFTKYTGTEAHSKTDAGTYTLAHTHSASPLD